MNDTAASTSLSKLTRFGLWQRLAFGVLIISAALIFSHYIGQDLDDVEAWITGLGPWAPVTFIALFIILTPIGFSNVVFGLVAGALFGLAMGTFYLVVAGFIAEVIMFYLARTFFRRKVEQWLQKHPKLSAFDTAASKRGLGFMILVRLSPLPYSICCYLFATSRVKFSTYLLGFVGFIPGNFVIVYFGVAAKHVTKMMTDTSTGGWTQNAALFGGLAISLLIILYITHIARKAVADVAAEEEAKLS